MPSLEMTKIVPTVKTKKFYAKTGSLASKFGAEWSFLVPELYQSMKKY